MIPIFVMGSAVKSQERIVPTTFIQPGGHIVVLVW